MHLVVYARHARLKIGNLRLLELEQLHLNVLATCTVLAQQDCRDCSGTKPFIAPIKIHDKYPSVVHDVSAPISGRGVEMDATTRTLTGFIMESLPSILCGIHLYSLLVAYILIWDALERFPERYQHLPPITPALDTDLPFMVNLIPPAVSGRFIAALGGARNVSWVIMWLSHRHLATLSRST